MKPFTAINRIMPTPTGPRPVPRGIHRNSPGAPWSLLLESWVGGRGGRLASYMISRGQRNALK